MEGLTAAIRHSERTHGISADLIMCFLRDRGAEAADQMLTAILPFREDIIGVGLDSTEIGGSVDSAAAGRKWWVAWRLR